MLHTNDFALEQLKPFGNSLHLRALHRHRSKRVWFVTTIPAGNAPLRFKPCLSQSITFTNHSKGDTHVATNDFALNNEDAETSASRPTLAPAQASLVCHRLLSLLETGRFCF
ncbi:MAG: hypothetical protein R3E79_23245 [Caldilineaceae bacterium]